MEHGFAAVRSGKVKRRRRERVVGVCTATKSVGWLELELVTQRATARREGEGEKATRRRMTAWCDDYALKYN